MFVITEAAAGAIRAIFEQEVELSVAIELRPLIREPLIGYIRSAAKWPTKFIRDYCSVTAWRVPGHLNQRRPFR
jgi:hypothetical protein